MNEILKYEKGGTSASKTVGRYLKRNAIQFADSGKHLFLNLPFDAAREFGAKIPVTALTPTAHRNMTDEEVDNYKVSEYGKDILDTFNTIAGAEVGVGILGKALKPLANQVKRVLGNNAYIKGTKRILDKGHYLNNQDKRRLLQSPKTIKAVGNIEEPAVRPLLRETSDGFVGFGEDGVRTTKDFRQYVKNFNRNYKQLTSKIENPAIPSSVNPMYNYTTSPSEMRNNFIKQEYSYNRFNRVKESTPKHIAYQEKLFDDKLKTIKSPVLRDIVTDSPQYIDEIAAYSTSPKGSESDFVNHLINKSQTYTRAISKPVEASQFLKLQGRSMGFGKRPTMDVEGFPLSGDYGSYRYKLSPNQDYKKFINDIPLENRWKNKINYNFGDDVIISDGMHTSINKHFRNQIQKSQLRDGFSNVPTDVASHFRTYSQIAGNKKFIQNTHQVFSGKAGTTPSLRGFDVSEIPMTNPWASGHNRWNTAGLEDSFTKGFKFGGLLKKR